MKPIPSMEVFYMSVYQGILKKLEAGEAVALETVIRGKS